MVNLKDACFQIPIWEGVAPLLDRRPWELLVCWDLLSHVQVALFHPFLQGLKIWGELSGRTDMYSSGGAPMSAGATGAFPPKVLFNFHMHQSVELRYLCLAQEWGEEDQEGSWLSHWVMETIQQAHKVTGALAPGGMRAYSTQGVATSWALSWGASLSENRNHKEEVSPSPTVLYQRWRALQNCCLFAKSRRRMAPLELILIFALQIEASVGVIYLNYSPGRNVILPCDGVSSSDRFCSTVSWLYSKDLSETSDLVQNGNVVNNSAQAARLIRDTKCSLVINNITAEDAGFYTCRQRPELDIVMYLNIMTGLRGGGPNGPPGVGGPRGPTGAGGPTYLYYTPGVDVILPCSSSDRDCSMVKWLYNRVQSQTSLEVLSGKVVTKSTRATKLSLDTYCSLVIDNITAADAGYYTCRKREHDTGLFLSIMTIFPSPPDADPKRDGNVTLECSLLRYSPLGCRPNSIRWVGETGTVLLGEGVGYEIIGQTDCVSVLTVKRQSGHNRRYTCQWMNKNNKVRIEAHYTPVFTEGTIDDQSEKSITGPSLYIITGAVVGVMMVVVVVVVITAVFIKFKKRHTVTEDFPKTVNPPDPQEPQDEPDGSLTYVTVNHGSLTYVTVNHANQETTSKKKVKEEGVTYSTVKTTVTMEADSSKIYSYVNEQK
ncbi:uncharacterized protein LOC121882767 [Thunnus maccoyii]|uniref:uncharacterized protein LOC121882767 n=1 Tax=Thunnus maccoyii TaxID=8240 RepID=UPI001C4A8780|nr:uncharacterized protein LOC121882767 [Thunnus maccoyii]